VYRERRTCIVGMLFTKDLILVDPDDELEVSTIMGFR
jgi:metal transporter CNNM